MPSIFKVKIMSQLDNLEALEKQLAELQMVKEMCTTGKGKKVPPAVPPKKKTQPHVPRSALNSEPSYSTKMSTSTSNNETYNTLPNKTLMSQKDYANLNHLEDDFESSTLRQNLSNTTYSNLSHYKANDMHIQLPPPPPPPPLTTHTTLQAPLGTHNLQYMTLPLPKPSSGVHQEYMMPVLSKSPVTTNSEEYMPPPSPVSSNYSELTRANANLNYNHDRTCPPVYQNNFPEYNMSQAPTYESFYEPISPHPSSKTAMQENNLITKKEALSKRSPLPKEQEVDALTNLLVQSITDSQDLDVFGICVKCGERISGENAGCTAMGNTYHVHCFTCQRCNVNLQGKPFYDVENEPYCEADYYDTLEKCCVCRKIILDRILRATGKPYHPTCFSCVECGKSLDGIPFTVDAMNQIHCIDDFHKKFAPRCCVCELPIMPEEGQEETVRVVALDRSFHVKCYRCEDCGLLLSSEAEGRGCYPLDDHILCKTCNARRVRLLTNVMTTDL